MRALIHFSVLTSVSLAFATPAFPQGQFVFDTDTPERPKRPVVLAIPPKAAAREPDVVLDDLATFTFGGPSEVSDQPLATGSERAYWASLTVNPTMEGYRRYLKVYPDGAFADEARAQLEHAESQ